MQLQLLQLLNCLIIYYYLPLRFMLAIVLYQIWVQFSKRTLTRCRCYSKHELGLVYSQIIRRHWLENMKVVKLKRHLISPVIFSKLFEGTVVIKLQEKTVWKTRAWCTRALCRSCRQDMCLNIAIISKSKVETTKPRLCTIP